MKKQDGNVRVRGWKLLEILQSIDMFGTSLPMFNIKGRSTVHGTTGGIMTFLVLSVWLTYACHKFVQLILMSNTQVSEVIEQNFFDYKKRLNLGDIGFKVAFSVEGYKDNEMKDDPRYVKYFVRLINRKNYEFE